MSSKPLFVASDMHLGAVPEAAERGFIRWLEYAGSNAGEVIINGDLFDFWFEYRTGIPKGHTRVLGALSDLVDAGIPVTHMGGNHDWWTGPYLRDEIGLTLYHDPVELELAGLRTLLAHGDGLGNGDLGYRALRLLLRSRPTVWAFRLLHPDLGAALAHFVSRTDDRIAGPSDSELGRSSALEKWAVEALRQRPELDLVILGHTHIPMLMEVEPGRYYVNAGDWVHHWSYLVLQEGQPPRLDIWEDCGSTSGTSDTSA